MKHASHYRNESLWDFMSEIERAFDDVWRHQPRTAVKSALAPRSEFFTPAVDLHEEKDFYLVSMDLPGVAEKDIQIAVQEGRLTVSGERSRAQNENIDGFRRFERSYGRFERAFALPQNVSTDQVQARFENGVLEVLIPKAEVAKSRSIPINKEKNVGLFSRLLRGNQVDSQATSEDRADRLKTTDI